MSGGLPRDCENCPDRIECTVCHRKLCHGPCSKGRHGEIDGHYLTPDGVVCPGCYQKSPAWQIFHKP